MLSINHVCGLCSAEQNLCIANGVQQCGLAICNAL